LRQDYQNFKNYDSSLNAPDEILSILLILSFPFGIDNLNP